MHVRKGARPKHKVSCALIVPHARIVEATSYSIFGEHTCALSMALHKCGLLHFGSIQKLSDIWNNFGLSASDTQCAIIVIETGL